MLSLLKSLLLKNTDNTLWIADENSTALLQQDIAFSGVLLTNRWDIAQLAKANGIPALFNDFNLKALTRSFQTILYPLSKEKAIVQHLINEAPYILNMNGSFILLGEKNSGIKTYAKKVAERFNSEKNLQKTGKNYLSINIKKKPAEEGELLTDNDYHKLQQPEKLSGLFSKPGLFGWDKIDNGSAFLANQFAEHPPAPNAKILDLGCGYGFLSTQLASLGQFHFTATDNNAAALLSCKKNFSELDINGEIIPSDAGKEIKTKSVDYVICNPPFHQGFRLDEGLTDQFLKQAARILKQQGQALFVVNEFIPLAKKSLSYFSKVECIAKNRSFCIYLLTWPL